MTLIYSKKTIDNQFLVHSDTQITRDTSGGKVTARELPNIIPGELKLFVINEHFTLGYAGVCEFATLALRDIWKSEFSKDDILSLIEKHYRSSMSVGDGTDFLLCDFNDALTYKWSNGFDKIQTEGDCWIGNGDAALALSSGNKNFDEILTNAEFDNIGGIKVTVESCHRRFKYQQITGVQVETEFYGGSFHYSIATPHSSLPYIGIYFQGQNWGYLYDHLNKNEPTKIEFASADEFVEKLHSITGIDFLMATSSASDGSNHLAPSNEFQLRLINKPDCPYKWSHEIRKATLS